MLSKAVNAMSARLARTAAWRLAALYAAIFVLAGVTLQISGEIWAATALAMPIVTLHMAWAWGVVVVADKHALSIGMRWISFVLTVVLILMSVVASATGSLEIARLCNAIGSLTFIASVWVASSKLVEAERQGEVGTIAAKLGTAILVFYLPFGVWFIQPRVVRLVH